MNERDGGLTGIIPFTYIGGLYKASGSTFLRCDGLVANAEDFKVWRHGHKYDNLIFQKAYWKEMMTLFKGPKILDLCDPDWLTGNVDIIATGRLADAITCSSERLTDLVRRYFPHKQVMHVPDRLNFKVFPPGRPPHTGRAGKITWFGFINNAHETLPALASVIRKHDLQLTIISDFPYSQQDEIAGLQPAFIKYAQSTAYHFIRDSDIVLNPKSEKALYKYKSNNKTIISWKLNVPVAETGDDLEMLLDPGERNRQVAEKKDLVENEYNITRSAGQYRELLESIRSGK